MAEHQQHVRDVLREVHDTANWDRARALYEQLVPDPAAVALPGTVPVLELGPRWLAWWARLVTGQQRDPAEGVVLLVTGRQLERETEDSTGAADAVEQVKRFRSMASPPALRLAMLLAAVPVHPDVAQLVQQRLVPDAGPKHLTELFVSAIRYSSEPRDRQSTWDTGVLAFPEAVRELLLSGARRTGTAAVVRVAATYFGERIAVLGHLRDAIADPNNTPDPDLIPRLRQRLHWRAVMRALSGPYLSRADRLRKAVLAEPQPDTESIQSRPPTILRASACPRRPSAPTSTPAHLPREPAHGTARTTCPIR